MTEHHGTSLSRRIPVFLAGFLVLVLGTAATIEYVQLRSILLQENEDRLSSVTELVAELLSGQMTSGADERRATADSLVSVLVDASGTPRTDADRVLADVVARRSQGRAIWMLAADGACLASSRMSGGGTRQDSCPPLEIDPATVEEPTTGPIHAIDGEARYRTVVPAVGDAWSGHVVFEQAFASAEGGALVSNLVAEDARLWVGNREDGVWTDLGSVVEQDLSLPPGERMIRFNDAGDERIGAVIGMSGTPWVALIHRAEAVVLAPSRTFLLWTLASAAVLLVISSVLGWALTLRVTRPLTSLTESAEAIAAGEYDRRVGAAGRDDEIGRLAEAFDVMATKVDEHRQALEDRVAERTQNLQDALDQLRETQEAMVRQERLATIGQLAGGVGHELRNPLGVMTNALYYLDAVNADAPDKVKEYMGILKEQVATAEKIVSDLLDFARVKAPDRQDVRVRDIVEEVLGREEVPEGVDVELDIRDATPRVHVDPAQVSQVVQNLVSNALHAMEETGGRLTFGTAWSEGSVNLAVSDTGSGIPADQLAHVFEPLVTSKAKGIGLGLAVSRSLAQANGAELSARSEVGLGSTFELSLPEAPPRDGP